MIYDFSVKEDLNKNGMKKAGKRISFGHGSIKKEMEVNFIILYVVNNFNSLGSTFD